MLRRCSWLGKYVAISKQLQQEEDAILKAMTPEMRKGMKCKRLALFRRMLQDEKYPDSAIVDDMCRGFDLVGDGAHLQESSRESFLLQPPMLMCCVQKPRDQDKPC